MVTIGAECVPLFSHPTHTHQKQNTTTALFCFLFPFQISPPFHSCRLVMSSVAGCGDGTVAAGAFGRGSPTVVSSSSSSGAHHTTHTHQAAVSPTLCHNSSMSPQSPPPPPTYSSVVGVGSSSSGPSAIPATSGGTGHEKWIWVLDPMTRKLRVPWSCFVPTAATSTPGTVPSLCIAFLEGRCRHPWCRQAHVLPSMIAQLRHDALNAPTCCACHNDPHDLSILSERFQSISITDSSMTQPIPVERIALTVGLQRYLAHTVPAELAGNTLEVPSKLICRLHLSHRCRYLEDCNNIHVCREYDLRLHPPPFMLAPLLALTMASRAVTLGDTVYSVTPLAAGEVSDDEFHTMCDQHQASLSNRNGGGGGGGANTPLPASSPVVRCSPTGDAGLGYHHGGHAPSPLAGTPVMSFSTPPLAHAPTTLALPAFSSTPEGLPSFAATYLAHAQLGVHSDGSPTQSDASPTRAIAPTLQLPVASHTGSTSPLPSQPPPPMPSATKSTISSSRLLRVYDIRLATAPSAAAGSTGTATATTVGPQHHHSNSVASDRGHVGPPLSNASMGSSSSPMVSATASPQKLSIVE